MQAINDSLPASDTVNTVSSPKNDNSMQNEVERNVHSNYDFQEKPVNTIDNTHTPFTNASRDLFVNDAALSNAVITNVVKPNDCTVARDASFYYETPEVFDSSLNASEPVLENYNTEQMNTKNSVQNVIPTSSKQSSSVESIKTHGEMEVTKVEQLTQLLAPSHGVLYAQPIIKDKLDMKPERISADSINLSKWGKVNNTLKKSQESYAVVGDSINLSGRL